jgi:hypothetical protein
VHLVEDTKASSLPPIEYRTVRFDMAGWSRVFYDEMKADLVAKLPEGGEIEAANQAVKSGKLRQIASGFTYSETGCAHHLDFERVQALGRVLTLAPADKTVIFYEYTEQLTHLQGCNEMTTESVEEFINGAGALPARPVQFTGPRGRRPSGCLPRRGLLSPALEQRCYRTSGRPGVAAGPGASR